MRQAEASSNGVPYAHFSPADRLARYQAGTAAKRMFDVCIASLLLLALSPILTAISLAVWATSGRPIFYRWLVVGQNGQPFVGYKFRTMVANADELKEKLLETNEMNGPVFKMKLDPRVTALGRLLRKYSLDELPQLWSVLKGDMSLVGPRPPLQNEYQLFTPWQRQKLAVKPGMTCLWQIRGRNNISTFNDWVAMDLEYIERWSFWLDLQILVLTAPAVVSGRGAS